MWLLLFACVLQIFLVGERVLNALLSVLLGTPASPVRKLSTRSVLAALFSQIVVVVSLPLQIVLLIMELAIINLWSFAGLALVMIALIVASRAPAPSLCFSLTHTMVVLGSL